MFDVEIREKARKLIIFEGRTQEEVAKNLRISERTVTSWSKLGSWTDKRKEYMEITEDLELKTFQLLRAATDKALRTLDNQDIYTVIQLHMFIGNSNNQLYRLRPFIIKDLIDVKNKTLEEVAELFGLKVGKVKKIYKKALDSQSITADAIN